MPQYQNVPDFTMGGGVAECSDETAMAAAMRDLPPLPTMAQSSLRALSGQGSITCD
jgi:hypothetical protein